MRNSFFAKWMLASLCLTLTAYVLLPPRGDNRASIVHGIIDEHNEYTTDGLRQRLLNLDDFLDPSLDFNSINGSDLHLLQTADEFLPYLAIIPSLPALTADEVVGTCNFTEEELSSFQYDSHVWWKVNPCPESEIAPLRLQWQQFLQRGLIPWSQVEHLFDGGVGIVIVAGQEYSLERLKVTLRVLRQHFNTTLPVELSFHGDDVSESQKAALGAIYGSDHLFFNDLSLPTQIWKAHDVNKTRGLNYQLKMAALINSRFREILMLDSDNIPVMDLAELFASENYQRFGSVFWPDLTRTRPEHPAWRITNTECRRDEYEFETGQLMVNKSRLWYHLQLAAWLHTQPFWRKTILGDKDLFRFAWHALRTRFGRPVKWITSVGFMVEQPSGSLNDNGGQDIHMDFCGHSFAQHHPDHSSGVGDEQGSGIAFLHGGNLKTIGAPFAARLRVRPGGMFMYYKQLDVEKAEDWNQIEHGTGQKILNTGWYLNHTRDLTPQSLVSSDEDLDLDGSGIGEFGLERLELTERDGQAVTWCSDFRYIKPQPLSNFGWVEMGYELLFERAGGYWMIEKGYRW